MIDLKVKEVQEIAKYFSCEVNNLFFKPDRIAEEQKDSKQMKDLDFCWIKILSGQNYMTDLRNEASAMIGRQLAEIPFVKEQMELVSNQKMKAVAKWMAMEHRTLQQTFSKLIFYHLMLACNKEELEEMIEVMGDSFYMLPLI